jgi:hypothetical protein
MRLVGIYGCLLLIVLLLHNLEGAGGRSSQKLSPLQLRVSRFQKYLRAPNPQAASKKKTPPRKLRPPRMEEPRPALKAIHTNSLNNLQNLYSIYNQCLETHRYYVDFLKQTPELTLKEFKIRTQQWKVFTASSLENLVLIRTRLNYQLSYLHALNDDLESAIPEFLDTAYYSEWIDLQQNLDFEESSLEYLAEKLASLLISQVGKVQISTKKVVQNIEALHQKHWDQDRPNPRLRDQKQLVRKIKSNAVNTRKWISGLANHFTYAENRILLEYSRLQKNSFPSKTKITPVLRRSHFRKMEAFQARIKDFLEREGLESAILEARLKRSKEVRQPELYLPALSKHLFFNHTRLAPVPESKFSAEPSQEFPDWI